jgi:hypothetical protein
VVALPATLPIGEALARVAALGNGHDLQPVVLPRRTDAVRPSVAEAVGVVSVAELTRLVAEDGSIAARPVSEHVGGTLAAAGVGDTAATALARITPDGAAAWVLVDGRITGVVTRDELDV